MRLLYFREIAACLAGYLHVSNLLIDMIPVLVERIEQILAIGLGNHGHRIARRVEKQGPDCFEGRLLGGEIFVDAQFIVSPVACADTYRPVIAENQAPSVPFPPLAEDPGIRKTKFLFPDHFNAGQFLVRQDLARFLLEDILSQLLQFLHALAPQVSRFGNGNLAAGTTFQQ